MSPLTKRFAPGSPASFNRSLDLAHHMIWLVTSITFLSLAIPAVTIQAQIQSERAEIADAVRDLEMQERVHGPDSLEAAISARKLAGLYENAKRFQEAETLYVRALRIHEKVLDPDHSGAAATLRELAGVYSRTGAHDKAEPLYERALAIWEKKAGPSHPDTAVTRRALGWLYANTSRHKQAIPPHEQALASLENALGADHPETLQTLDQLAEIHVALGAFDKAEPLYQKALTALEKSRGPDDPEIAVTLIQLAHVYSETGRYPRAGEQYKRALAIRERSFGPEHPATSDVLSGLGSLYSSMGAYAEAEKLLVRALRIREAKLDPSHLAIAGSLMALGNLYHAMGDYRKAEPLKLRALAIREKVSGPDSMATANSLQNLAGLYFSMGAYGKAEALYLRELAILEKHFGPSHAAVGHVLCALGGLHYTVGAYDKAETSLQRAILIVEQTYGPETPIVATVLANLAMLYEGLGDQARAEPLLRRAREICERRLTLNHPETAAIIDMLAGLCASQGDYPAAEKLYRQAWRISEQTLGSTHDSTAIRLNNLAGFYHRIGDYAKARPLLEQAVHVWGLTLGVEHPATAFGRSHLANLYRSLGDQEKAQALFQEARAVQEKVLGPSHPHLASTLGAQALLFLDGGLQTQALQSAIAREQIQVRLLAGMLGFTSEQQRAAYQTAEWDPYALLATLGAAPETALAVLRRKGIVLDSLLEDRQIMQASQDSEEPVLAERLREAKQRLTQFLLEIPQNHSSQSQQRETKQSALTREVEELERALARRVTSSGRTRRALSVTVPQVQQAIPRQAVLVEFLRYLHYQGKDQWEPRYGAIVLAARAEPRWVPLGSAEAIEHNVARYQQAARAEVEEAKPPISNPKSQAALSALLQALYQQLWAPLHATLPKGTRTVILSPDGSLNFLSFATLLTPDDQFLCQEYDIRYVSSGRDLLKAKKRAPNNRVSIYANPDFGGKGAERFHGQSSRPATPASAGTDPAPSPAESGTGVLAQSTKESPAVRYLDRRDLQDLRLDPLPGTAKEGTALMARAIQWNWPTDIFVEAEASEARLAAAGAPRILHLATHGFFLPEAEGERGTVRASERRGVGGVRPNLQPDLGHLPGASFGSGLESGFDRLAALKNPMHRSGLALAGAQATLEAWKRGETPLSGNDGIVTAEEVGTLRLEGTELVVLSACDTGMGKIRSGEGVLGLRRGFIQAGAENLLMTLWNVSDVVTAQIMEDFYERFQATGQAPQALAEVQREWLVKLREQRSLPDAVRLAGPFILSSQGAAGSGN